MAELLSEARRIGIVVVLVAIGFLITGGVMGLLGGGVVGLMAAWLLYRAVRGGDFRTALRRLTETLRAR